ncbi:MAG: outer membrane beta-barrel family protein [Mucilaginibacter sp.]|uniref:outer membrane beta-barrel family protein n=1 Tax=Mucilaginibacter sp. TaxID=1882438 RepID=UPI003267CAAA
MKTLYNILYTTLAVFALLQTSVAWAQVAKPNVQISGSVLDEKGNTMPFATIGLLKAKDSSLVKGAITTENGSYKFERVNQGSYIVRVNVMGYTKTNSKPINVNADATDIKVPVIKLSSSSKALKEVNITSNKPLIERKFDRTIMNVENSVLAAGNSALEILERAPGVTIDKDDNISLKGKQGVTVMLDGKLTYLSSAQLATLLRSTDGNTIQSIEIITNPSAKYDASGNSGIINIKLKKNKMAGTNGSLSLSGGLGTYFKSSESLSLNHKDGKVNIFGSYSHGNRERANNFQLNRLVDSATKTTYFTQHTFMGQKPYNNNYRFGIDYDITKKNTIGFLVNGYFNGEHNYNDNNTLIGDQPNVIQSHQYTYSQVDQSYTNFALNLNDKYQIDTAGQELSFDIDYSKFNNNNNAHYDTYFYTPAGVQQFPPAFIRNQSPSTITINTEKLDYAYPLTKTLKLEAGFKTSNVKTDNDLQAQLLKSGTWINDTSRTNRFVYNEQIIAGYFNLAKEFKKTSVQVGLRTEHTTSNGDLISRNGVPVIRKYLDLFPSLFINQTLSPKNEVSFSYSRRIDRPGYDDLNPFVFYLDQYTYSQGNPFLNPQYTHSFEFNYTYNKAINVTLSYSHTSDAITEIILTDTLAKSTHQTRLNLQSQNAYNINVYAPYTISKWWNGNVSLITYYINFKSNDLAGGNLDDGKAAFQLKTTQTFLLSKTFKAEVATNYQSPQTYGIYKIEQRYSADAGLSKSFMEKKLNIKFSVSDVFNTNRNRLSSRYQSVNFDLNQKNESRVGRLTLTYNFGNAKIKMRQHSTNSDEKNRVKGGN